MPAHVWGCLGGRMFRLHARPTPLPKPAPARNTIMFGTDLKRLTTIAGRSLTPSLIFGPKVIPMVVATSFIQSAEMAQAFGGNGAQ